MSDTPLTTALTTWRTAHKGWSDKSSHSADVLKQLNDLLNAATKPADYDRKLTLLREELAVANFEVAVSADATRSAHAELKMICIREALKTFMATNGAGLTDALFPYLKGNEGVEPAVALLREALLNQIETREPQVLSDYSAAITEAGISLNNDVWKDSGDNYTPAQHYAFRLRREALDKLSTAN